MDDLKLDWPGFNNIIPSSSLMPIVRDECDNVRDFAFSECSGDWHAIIDEKYKYSRTLHYSEPGAIMSFCLTSRETQTN